MLCDHTQMVLRKSLYHSIRINFLNCNVNQWLNIIGRMAFPIYAFFIAEGCRKTKSMKKYFLNLLLFALISQPIYVKAYEVADLNILFSLATSVLSIYAYNLIQKYVSINQFPKVFQKLIPLLAIFTGSFISLYFQMSYWPICVPMIFSLYIFPKHKNIILFFFCTIFYLFYASWDGMGLQWTYDWNIASFYIISWLISCFPILLVNCYTGLRKKGSKYGFYLFYPSHLLLLLIIKSTYN